MINSLKDLDLMVLLSDDAARNCKVLTEVYNGRFYWKNNYMDTACVSLLIYGYEGDYLVHNVPVSRLQSRREFKSITLDQVDALEGGSWM